MTAHVVKTMGELVRLIKRHAKQREAAVKAAVRRAARKAALSNSSELKRNIPVAFGELREAVHVEGAQVIVDAPHAAAVNNGSRPHWMPLAPLIAWVKLRGMQALATERQIGRMPGTSTKGAAEGVGAMLAAQEHRGPAGHSDVDAAEQVARMIQLAIAKRGTKPHHFIEKSLPGMFAVLAAEIQKAISGDDGGGPGSGDSGGSGGGAGAVVTSTKSGAFRKNANTYHGKTIQTDAHGNKFVDRKNGRTYLKS